MKIITYCYSYSKKSKYSTIHPRFLQKWQQMHCKGPLAELGKLTVEREYGAVPQDEKNWRTT